MFIWFRWGFLCYHAAALFRTRGERRYRRGVLSRTVAPRAADVWLDGSAGRDTAHARRPRSCARIPLVYRRRVYTPTMTTTNNAATIAHAVPAMFELWDLRRVMYWLGGLLHSIQHCWHWGSVVVISCTGRWRRLSPRPPRAAIISPAEEEVLGDKQHKIFTSQSIKLVFVKLY